MAREVVIPYVTSIQLPRRPHRPATARWTRQSGGKEGGGLAEAVEGLHGAKPAAKTDWLSSR